MPPEPDALAPQLLTPDAPFMTHAMLRVGFFLSSTIGTGTISLEQVAIVVSVGLILVVGFAKNLTRDRYTLDEFYLGIDLTGAALAAAILDFVQKTNTAQAIHPEAAVALLVFVVLGMLVLFGLVFVHRPIKNRESVMLTFFMLGVVGNAAGLGMMVTAFTLSSFESMFKIGGAP